MTPISELGDAAVDAVSDLLDDMDYDGFLAMTHVEKVQWRYCHADCDDFALTLNKITGWPVVAVNDSSKGPVHRLVQSPDGRLLDARGWNSPDDLKRAYRLKKFTVDHESIFHSPTIDCNEDFFPVVSAIMQLPLAPFNTEEFKAKTMAFAQRIEMPLETISRRRKSSIASN